MPRTTSDVRTAPSVLTRLIDDAPEESQDRTADRHQSIRELKQAVRKDLEALLNTRQETLDELPAGYEALDGSLLTYGLPDFTCFDLASQQDRGRVARSLEQAITIFEPRLDRIRVRLEEQRASRGLHFRIEAVLRVEPSPEPVRFDAELQPTTQRYRVQGSD